MLFYKNISLQQFIPGNKILSCIICRYCDSSACRLNTVLLELRKKVPFRTNSFRITLQSNNKKYIIQKFLCTCEVCNVIRIHQIISLGRQQKNAIIHKWKFLVNIEKCVITFSKEEQETTKSLEVDQFYLQQISVSF